MPRRADDFREATKNLIGRRAGWHCAFPTCRRLTEGGDISIGEASHICAASPGGRRYDPNQKPEERRAAENGIWMCRVHGKAIDSKDAEFTVQVLRQWKAQAEREAREIVLRGQAPALAIAPSAGELAERLRAATQADLDILRRSGRWPSSDVPLMAEVEGFGDPVTPSGLARMLATLDDLVLIAPPGMGKTSTVLQIAEALSRDGKSPIVVPLADWSTDGAPLVEAVLKRPAFRTLSDEDLRRAAGDRGVVILLDGWNELDAAARKRLKVQVGQLQAELPQVSLLISTRRQALDVPVDGAHVSLLPLSQTQQRDIAMAVRGESGVRVVDQAWRTAGIRELVTIPLYLKTLLDLPEGAPFPATKEELLGAFVIVHERDLTHAEALAEVTHGSHGKFLEALAVTATRALNTTLPVDVARKAVADAAADLVDRGQLAEKPEPNTVLEALVNHHVLTRAGDPAGYSFQHQQFQEWYASHFVERLMLASAVNAESQKVLKRDVLNLPAWEESILFTCERLARGAGKEQDACALGILSAFEVDPMLAAEMIFRAGNAVWEKIGKTIQERIRHWHKPGTVDRAVRFMITSGRPEFGDLIWPLISDPNKQVHLRVLRAARQFRPSILGDADDASRGIAALPEEIREHVLHEIAFNSGMDGMDLATAIAKNDPSAEVKAQVVEGLAFRRAHRHAVEILRSADEKTFDLVAQTDLLDDVDDESVSKGLQSARERRRRTAPSSFERLQAIVHSREPGDFAAEVTAIVAEMDFPKDQHSEAHIVYEARARYPGAVAEGLLQRIRTGKRLYYGADDLLASAGISLEDDTLLEIALADTVRDDRAQAAASVLGPRSVKRMIDAALEVEKTVRDEDGKYNEKSSERYSELLSRIAHAQGANLLAAVRTRSEAASVEELADLAELIARHPGDIDRGRPFDEEGRAQIRSLVADWGERMLASPEATRWHLSSLASMAARAPAVSLLPLLKRMLDENLRRYRAVLGEAKATGWKPGKARDEASHPLTHEYFKAFQEIDTTETAAMMRDYLKDEHFGELAAKVLYSQWIAAHEPEEKGLFHRDTRFHRVAAKRAQLARDPKATSNEAEAIFDVVESLIADGSTEGQQKLAIALAIVAAPLPHGQRDQTIQRLIALAPRRARADLLRNLTLSGETVEVELVKKGIAEVLEEGKMHSWILYEGYQPSEWLTLLPFTSRPSETLDIVRGLPEFHSKIDVLEGLIAALGVAPGEDAEKVLFQLAEAQPKLYASRQWRDAAFRRRSAYAAREVVNLASNGVFPGPRQDPRGLASEIAGLIAADASLRGDVYERLKDGANTPGLTLLAHAVAEAPDVEGFVLLVKLEIQHKRSFMSWRTLDAIVTENIPVDGADNVYTTAPVPAAELRQKLLALTKDGGAADPAASYLRKIDEARDEHGIPEAEPRHPDLESGKEWPILVPSGE